MSEGKYTIKKLKKATRNPEIFKNHIYNQIQTLKNKTIIKQVYNGENFIQKDWDNLIVLDACRPDFFKKYNPFEGEFSQKVSLGASSPEFFSYNFRKRQFHDTVYVTGNTNIERISEDSVHKIIKTYAETNGVNKGWLPETTFEHALRTYNEYPDKRMVVHFMQPHAPYLGDHAKKLRRRVAKRHQVRFRYMDVIGAETQKDADEHIRSLIDAFKYGYISQEQLGKVYAENLRIVFEYVEELLRDIDGKTVITSDHSESFGDFNGIYGHKDYSLSKKLREVPWLVIDGDRRDTYSDPPVESASIDESIIHENLRDLGYM